jgi:MurNAc alpha-1-phosphate uridylyltransferase|tara:strand:- start:3597 stop:4265 length:669 start_codon:yes stop_codon:yes gene_type:complete
MKVFLLAAGLGRRLLPHTANKPKCLIDIGGKPLLSWHVEKLKSFGIDNLIINLFHKGEQIENFLGDGSKWGINIEYVYEKELLGTGGGIGNALSSIGSEPFIVMSGDVWTDFDFSNLSLNEGSLAHLIMIENPPENPDGDMFLDKGKVNSSGEGRSLTFSGLALIDPQLFIGAKAGKYDLWKEILLPASEKGQVSAEVYGGYLVNINTIEDLEKLDAYLLEE